ncbi:FHA domain-containing protein [Streptomyces sp. 4N509B]|uniref:FHA domain-containing protein n=1 Tax=Streptomyces sp. 4N509B TaxID=3457413 RepID=UPI003FD25B92
MAGAVAVFEALARHLTADPADADALVDLSNVVRNPRIGDGSHPRSLDRLRMVIEALARRTADEAVRVVAIADRSLRHGVGEYPHRAEPALLARWIDEGLVEEAADADEPLLELADVTELPVISNDDFRDFRTTHRWIQGDTTRFLGVERAAGPGRDPAREVVLRERDMGVRTPAQISRKLEESDLKAHGLLQGRHRRPLTEVVKRHWHCPERGCRLYDSRRGVAIRLPLMRRGTPLCELHRVPLVDDGPRTGVAQLKLLVDGECVHRFTLDAGATAELGRAPGDGGIALHGLLPDELSRRVSRRHLVARAADDAALQLRNLSANGTRLLRHGGGDWTPLSDERFVHVNVNDVVELVPRVTVTRSARRYPSEIAAAWRDAARSVPRTGPAHAPTWTPEDA